MNVLFLTISSMHKYEKHDIYADILLELVRHGHKVYAISANQRRNNQPTKQSVENGINAIRVKTGNITQCGFVEKGISTVLIKYQFINAIKKYLKDVTFDLVLYATPPITIADVVKYIKKRDGAMSYLMLKDIFPQNAIDLGLMRKTGLKSILYKYFRKEEKKLYSISDRIGCMSPANVEYILKNNDDINKDKVEVFPNCIDPLDLRVNDEIRMRIRKKYNIPLDKTVFVYGGNLGRPQGIPFIIEALKASKAYSDAFFLIVGSGTEFKNLQEYVFNELPSHLLLLERIPKEDYDKLVGGCDVGLIFLDHRFEIPNFPSRLLSYLQAGLPVIAATDINSDIGKIAVENEFGWWCESNNVNSFTNIVKEVLMTDLSRYGDNGYRFMLENYSIDVGYTRLMEAMNEGE